MSGLASSTVVYISKDGGAFAQTTNSPSEIGGGVYKVTLTSTEAQFSTLIYKPICTDAQENVYIIEAEPSIPTASENATAVWGASARTLTASPTDISSLATASAVSTLQTSVNAIPTTAAPTAQNIWEYSSRTLTSSTGGGGATAQEVWEYATRTLTASPTDISGLATASALSSVASNVSAVKAKTDNLPASPAATGDAMTLTSAYDAAKTASQFDASTDTVTINSTQAATMTTATGFATPSDLTGLSTFDPSTDTVTIDSTQAATMVTATGFATPSDIPTASANASAVWSATTRTLTSSSGSGGATAQEVWEYSGGRTLTGSVTLTSAYDPAKTAAQAGDAMTLTSAYDKAKTAAAPGDEMTLTAAYDASKTAAPTAAAVASAVWSETTRTITGIPSTVTDLLNQLHALLGDWTMGQTTLTTSEGNYTLTRDNDGNIIAVTPSSQGS